MFSPHADFFEFALLDGRRITPTTRSRRSTAGSSLIQVRHKDEAFAGEIRHILRHRQPGNTDSQNTLLVWVAWMKVSNFTPLNRDAFIWNDFPELGIDSWELDCYAPPSDPSYPPNVIPLDKVHCQISRGRILHTQPKLWMTVTMDR
ncbi:hypothetical protein C8J57DRAFT_1577602, partial [Mycena rebaudengoi]